MSKPLNFKIRYHTNDGEIGVIINGVSYIYHLDAAFIPRIVKTSKKTPGKSLAFLKGVAYHYERR